MKATSALVSPGEDALLECAADAHPASSETITWQRPGFDLASRTGSRADLSGARLTSYLAVYDVTAADVGEFSCVVDNGVGGPVRATAVLRVTRECSDGWMGWRPGHSLLQWLHVVTKITLLCTVNAVRTVYTCWIMDMVRNHKRLRIL